MDVDTQSCEPDSTVEIADVRQLAPPTFLDVLREECRQDQLTCAEAAALVSSSIAKRDQVRQQLTSVQERRRVTFQNRKCAREWRETTIQATKNMNAQLSETVAKCNELRAKYEVEKAWQPCVTMTDEELEALKKRVATMRQRLAGDVQSPGSSSGGEAGSGGGNGSRSNHC